MNVHVNAPYEIRDGEIIRRAFTGSVIKSINQDLRQIEFIISTAAVDRYGDIITVSGWDLKPYKSNGVVLFGHNSSIPPIGKAIKTWKDGEALRSIAQFMTPDLSAFADSIYRMYVEGYLKAVSVGFIPRKYERLLDEEGNPTYSYKFLKQELLEFSAVPIPANAEALVAARSKGIDTLPFKAWAEEMLDNWNNVSKDLDNVYGVGRKEVENIRRRAAGSGASIQVPLELQDEILRRNLAAIRKSKAEKEAATTFETVDIYGQEHELPVRKLKDGEKLGTLEFSKDEDEDGGATVDIVKADDFVQIDPTVILAEDKTFGLTTTEYDGGSMLVLNITSETRDVAYELIGVDTEGFVFANKIKDTTPVTEEKEADADTTAEDKTEKKDATEDATADPVADGIDKDADEDEVVDKTANPIVNVVVSDPEALKSYLATREGEKLISNILKQRGVDKYKDLVDVERKPEAVKKDGDDTLDFVGYLGFIEECLCGFEETFDHKLTLSKHSERKKEFLAGYMRELADRLDGGVRDTGAKDNTAKAVTDKTVEITTTDDVKKYLENVMGSLQPMLTAMIESKFAKLRGRLD